MIVLAGFSASVLRAALMAGLALGAPLRGRRGDGLTRTGLCGSDSAAVQPRRRVGAELSALLRGYPGYPALARPLARLWPAARRSRWGSLLWESACVSLAAQLGTLPITALSFGYLPAYSLLSNLLVLPLVYGVMVFAFLTPPLPAAGCGGLSLYRCQVLCGRHSGLGPRYRRAAGAVLPCVAPWQWTVPAIFAVLLLAAALLRTKRARLRLLLLGCAAGVVLLGNALTLQSALTLTTDAATGSVLVQKNGEGLLISGVQDGYELQMLGRFLQRCGSPRITVLVQPEEQHDLSAELRLARLLEPELMLCSEETALLGEGQLPENVILLPNYDTVRNILSNYTLYSLDGVGTVLQFGTQKVLKCWAGYDIITAEDIPADITAVIDRRAACGWPPAAAGGCTGAES